MADLSSFLSAQDGAIQSSPWQNGMQEAQNAGQYSQLEELLKKIPRHILLQLMQGDMDRSLHNSTNNVEAMRQHQRINEMLQNRGQGQQWQNMPVIPGFGRYM